MTLLNAALAFVFFANAVFMIGAGYVLWRILSTTEATQINLQRAASDVISVGTHLKVLVRKAFSEMERNNDALQARESSSGRAVQELTSQLKLLVERVKQVMSQNKADQANLVSAPGPAGESLRDTLHTELTAVMERNNTLQDQIDQTTYKLNSASSANRELLDEINEVKGVKQSVIDSLIKRTSDLEAQLQQARDRAKEAERHAQDNARQLEDIRSQIHAQQVQSAAPEAGAAAPSIDQSGLIQSQQDQIDTLAGRERELLGRIEVLEGTIERNLTEKLFIEDRFLQLHGLDSVRAPLDEPPKPA